MARRIRQQPHRCIGHARTCGPSTGLRVDYDNQTVLKKWARRGGTRRGAGDGVERRGLPARGGGRRGPTRRLARARAGPVGEDGVHGERILHGGEDAEAAATAGGQPAQAL